MRSALRARVRSGVSRLLWELVTIYTPGEQTTERLARGRWIPAGTEESGGDNVEVVVERDQFAFDRRELSTVQALVRGAVIERENGERYVVQGVGNLRSEQHRVIVLAEGQ